MFMLKGIPENLSPELFKVLMEMGHGDEIVLADGNFPSSNYAQRLVRADGHGIPSLLDSILKFFPLDTFVEAPVKFMKTVDPSESEPPIWDTYNKILSKASETDIKIEYVERFEFYKHAQESYAILATSESALYGNMILKKGVIETD